MATRRQTRTAGRPLGTVPPSAFGGFKVRIPGSSMAVICADAGWRDDKEANDIRGHSELAVALAIAFAESGFYADATNRSSAGVACGLFQIMQPSVNPQLLDGATNARQAFRMYSGGGDVFQGPWSGSNYQPHLPMAELLVKAWHDSGNRSTGEKIGGIIGDIPNPLEAFDNVVDFLKVLFSGALWLRIAFVLAGSVLMFVAINTLLKGMGVTVPLPYGAKLGK